MRRWLFNIAAATSALVLLLTLATWMRSEFAYDDFHRFTWDSVTRRVTFDDVTPLRHDTGPRRTDLFPEKWYASRSIVRKTDGPATGTVVNRDFGMPLWPIVVVSGVLPVVWLRRHLRRRPGAGSCPSCGYDLCATPHRCRECGAVTEPTARSAA